MGRKYGGKWGEIGRKPPQSLPRFCPIGTHRSSPPPVWGRALGEETVDGVKELRLRSAVMEEGMDHLRGTRWPPWGQDGCHGDKMATMGVGDRAKMAAKWAKMATMGTRWPSWGWGTGPRWQPWGKMAAMGVGDRDKMATMGTRWQPMDHDGRHGVWRGGQGQDGGHGDKMAAMDGHLAKPRA